MLRTVAHAHGGDSTPHPGDTRGLIAQLNEERGRDDPYQHARRTLKDSAAVGSPPYRGKRSRFSRSAFTATNRLEPDIESAAISGLSTSPNAGSNTPAAIGIATEL